MNIRCAQEYCFTCWEQQMMSSHSSFGFRWSNMADAGDETTSSVGSEDYLNQLLEERERIDPKCQHTVKLLQHEINRLRQPRNGFVKDSSKCIPVPPLLEINTGRPCRVQVKVHVPVKDHPNFNFVGKLLGPKGSSLKQLQEVTQTRMAILGRGSVKDKQKEEEMRRERNPKYSHLQEDLHVEITAFATPAVAYRRISTALTEMKQYLVPDYFDDIRQQQLRELAILKDKTPKCATSESNVIKNYAYSNKNSSLQVTTANPTESSICTAPRHSISSQPHEVKKLHVLHNNYLITSNENLYSSATNGDTPEPGILRKSLRNRNLFLVDNKCEYEDHIPGFGTPRDEDILRTDFHPKEINFDYRSNFSDSQAEQTGKPILRATSSYRTMARFQTHPYN